MHDGAFICKTISDHYNNSVFCVAITEEAVRQIYYDDPL